MLFKKWAFSKSHSKIKIGVDLRIKFAGTSKSSLRIAVADEPMKGCAYVVCLLNEHSRSLTLLVTRVYIEQHK